MESGFADLGEYNGKKVIAVNYDLQKLEMKVETVDGEIHTLKIETKDAQV